MSAQTKRLIKKIISYSGIFFFVLAAGMLWWQLRSYSLMDILHAITTGKIIKQYEDDKPFASCLVLGIATNQKPLHLVLSHDEEFIYLITAYYPNASQWETDWETRK